MPRLTGLYWEQADYTSWKDEIDGQKEILHRCCYFQRHPKGLQRLFSVKNLLCTVGLGSGNFFFWNFRNQKEFWKISAILGKKSTNSRCLEQFEHSPDILAILHGKNVDKTMFVVFLPTKRGLSPLTCYSSVKTTVY